MKDLVTKYSLLIALTFVLNSCLSYRRIIDRPVFIAGGTDPRATSNCSQEFEAVPSAVLNPLGDIGWFAGFAGNRMTYAKGTWATWSAGAAGQTSPGFSIPINPDDNLNITGLTGDAWTTYSASKNLAFFYFIGRYTKPDGTSSSCISVAATPPAKLETNQWDFPAVCLSDLNSDQGAILHIDATNTFYAVSKRNGDILLQAFDNCSGAPGPEYNCPRTAMATIGDANALQFSLAENPCTHNLILAYRKNREIRLRFYDQQLRTLSEYVVRNNQPFENGQTNFGCSKGTILRCGMGTSDCCAAVDCSGDNGENTCLRVNGRPSIDTYMRLEGDNRFCGAVVAYDALMKASDGHDWSKSRLDIIDITNQNSPTPIARWNSTSNDFTWNQYMSHAVVTDNGPWTRHPKIAWFWLTDIRGQCNVIAEGGTSADLGSSMQATGIISGPFPAPALSSTSGIGDYFSGMKGGDRDGSLYVSWGEPVRSTGNCMSCKGERWNLATKITRIRWERIKRKPAVNNQSEGPFKIAN